MSAGARQTQVDGVDGDRINQISLLHDLACSCAGSRRYACEVVSSEYVGDELAATAQLPGARPVRPDPEAEQKRLAFPPLLRSSALGLVASSLSSALRQPPAHTMSQLEAARWGTTTVGSIGRKFITFLYWLTINFSFWVRPAYPWGAARCTPFAAPSSHTGPSTSPQPRDFSMVS